MARKKKAAIKGRSQGLNGRSPKVVATLTDAEMRAVQDAIETMSVHAKGHATAQRALQGLWNSFQAKYKLANQFQYNPKTGEVYESNV